MKILIATSVLFIGLTTVGACSSRPARTSDAITGTGARLRVLGSVQDGGLPHAGCSCQRCEADANGLAPDRHVASLALLTPDGEQTRIHLVDCTPDVREQLRLLRDVRFENVGGVDRAPIDGVFLTHAHMGHYSGLLHLGYEAMHTQGVKAYASKRMVGFLSLHAPWSQLIEKGEIVPEALEDFQSVEIDGVRVTPIAVPHRDEFSDTFAYRFEGPNQTVLYMPDCDPWRRWPDRAIALIESVDVAILDATFYDGEELPGRDLSKIGHPLAADTLRVFARPVQLGQLRVVLTHMNHTNPLLVPGSDARRAAAEAGVDIAMEGMEIGL